MAQFGREKREKVDEKDDTPHHCFRLQRMVFTPKVAASKIYNKQDVYKSFCVLYLNEYEYLYAREFDF